MLKDKVLEIAISQIGKQEVPKGSNWGPDVQRYLASVGITFPAPWCMAFVYWCTSQAATILKAQNPLFRTGSVSNQWYHAPDSIKHHDPLPGDIGIMLFPGGTGHTFLIEKVEGTMVATIEGNTNLDGSREGFEVERRVRPISAIHGFIRLSQ